MITPESRAKFNVDIANEIRRMGDRADRFVQVVTQTVFNEVQSGGRYSPGTPIANPRRWKHPRPHTGGFARANWVGGLGSPGASASVAPSQSTGRRRRGKRRGKGGGSRALVQASVQKNAEIAAKATAGVRVFFSNNAPYIRRLEFQGWSKQAPKGFVRLVLLHAPEIVKEAADYVARTP